MDFLHASSANRYAIEEYDHDGTLRSVTTYQGLRILIEKRAALLRAAGFEPDKIVGLTVRNKLESVVDVLALMSIKTPVVILDARDPLERRQAQLAHLCEFSWGDGVLTTLEPRSAYDLAEPAAVIVYTTGSTAASKPVAQGRDNLLANARTVATLHDLQVGERMACALPISHCNGFGLGLLAPLLTGATCMLFDSFSAQGYLQALHSYRATRATTVPSMLQSLLRVEQWPDLRLRYFISAAAALPQRTAQEVWKRGYRIVQGYGLSECMNFATTMSPYLTNDGYRSAMLDAEIPPVGPPLPGCSVVIENGEVLVGGHLMIGYVDNPEATTEALKDGLLHTGDLGVLAEGIGLTLTGRIKNVAKCGGLSVSLEEIDRWLLSLPGVDEVCAVKRPDERRGEAVTVYVVGTAEIRDVKEHVGQRYGGGTIGLEVEKIDAIPRLRNGKVARPELAALAVRR